MLPQNTLETYGHLKLHGMAAGPGGAARLPRNTHALSSKRLALAGRLAERLSRQNVATGLLRQTRGLQRSRGLLEEVAVSYKGGRGLDKRRSRSLPTEPGSSRTESPDDRANRVGKHWIGVRVGSSGCAKVGLPDTGAYPGLFEEIRTSHGDGSYLKLCSSASPRLPILILDDGG